MLPSTETFLAGLPDDNFTNEETNLRDAVLASLVNGPLAVSKLASDPRLAPKIASLLLKGVSLSPFLRAWIENRIGGEVQLFDEHGQKMCKLLSQNPPRQDSTLSMQDSLKHTTVTVAGSADFLKSLPGDELTEKELRLRQALLDFISRMIKTSGRTPTLRDAAGSPSVKRPMTELLPKDVELRSWIEERIGEEIELRPGPTGQMSLFSRISVDSGESGGTTIRGSASGAANAAVTTGQRTSEAGQRTSEAGSATTSSASSVFTPKVDAFFKSLPSDSFTDKEEALRDALLKFLKNWPSITPPTISTAIKDAHVNSAGKALLQTSGVKLKDWINTRIGGEVETRPGGGSEVVFGLVGQLDMGDSAKGKRKAESISGFAYDRNGESRGKKGK